MCGCGCGCGEDDLFVVCACGEGGVCSRDDLFVRCVGCVKIQHYVKKDKRQIEICGMYFGEQVHI